MKLKTLPRRLLAALMALLLAVGLAVPLSPSASAASEMDIYLVQLPSSSGSSKWSHGDMYFMNGWTAKSTTKFIAKGMGTRGGQIAYCIETGINLSSGNSLHYRGEDFWDEFPSSLNSTIPPALIRAYIGRIMQYGYTGECSSDWDVNSSHDRDMMANMMATQYLIWETVVGERDAGFNLVTPPDGCDAVHDMLNPNHPFYAEIQAYYDSIETSVKTHSVVPSFMTRSTGTAPTYELNWDGSGYSATLTDANGVLGNYQFSSDTAGVTFEVSGDDLIIRSATAPKGPVSVTAEKLNSMRRGVITWTDGVFSNENNGQRQDVVTYGEEVSDPVSGYMSLEVSAGSLKIIKTSEDGVVAGITFTITGNGVNQTVTTGSDGAIQVDDLAPGTYTVTEQPIDRYETLSAQQVTVVSGQTAEIHFANKLRRGSLEVTKTSEDGLVENVKFHLYGSSLSGAAVDEYAVTDSTGVARFENILIGSGYTLEEVGTAERYVVPGSQSVSIRWNEVTNRSFENVLKKWQATVTKSDAETGSPQGGASLAGAVYGVYQGDELVDTYTTDANGRFTTAYYPCGDDWSIREISPSEGYLLDGNSYHVGAEATLYTIERNSTELSVSEQVIKGKIALIKHTDEGETGIDTPEAGAEFQVYLKSAGSYENAEAAEKDYLICDEYGYAATKELPYGIYTVHQVSGWDGREMMHDFDVAISENGQVYRYLLNDAVFESMVEIVKKDAETGEVIPAAGIGFQVRNTDTGALVVQHLTYPTPMDIDTFYTDATGRLMLPDSLAYGSYELLEVQSSPGYVLSADPVPFVVDGTLEVVTVEAFNQPQKGVISIYKTGEQFTSVTDSDGIYQPVYTVAGLEGAVYEVTAAEDIYTPDGTLRSAAGEVVDTITTGADGTASTTELYLGKYEIREITAPYGMVLNEEVHTVELTYAGQEVSITETASSFYNERQRVQIDLVKALEQDDIFQFGMNNEITAVTFGLYAAEELTASDGSVIPADGLLEIVAVDESGHAAVKTDLPFGSYYLKELSTDSHYVLPNEKYPVVFQYAGQDVATVSLTANEGEVVTNEIIYGRISGLKIDRETEETIAGAVFGLFSSSEAEFTEKHAILTAESGEDGVFTFENVPVGTWIIRELQPVAGYLSNETCYVVQVSSDDQRVEITMVNDRIPELGTMATVDGEKEINATEVFTLSDMVEYKHLIPGVEYTLNGLIMNKATGEPLLIDGKGVCSKTTFIPEESSGSVVVEFTFDAKFIKEDTDIVAFESLYHSDEELAVHADINDEGQTVTIHVPRIGTTATIDGGKDTFAAGTIIIDDVVAYNNLTPGKEYTIPGMLMDKATGDPLLINGKEICAETTFTPETSDGEITVSFPFDSSAITEITEIVVFEALYREGVELAVHADINDKGQTLTIHVPEIGTQASIDGNKEAVAGGMLTIDDVISFTGLIPGKEYTIPGVLMDKATGKPFLVNGKEIRSEARFIPEAADGEVTVSFTFNSGSITTETELVAFESLYCDGIEIAVHADIEDADQAVTIHSKTVSTAPKTGDGAHPGIWIGLGATALGGLAAMGIIKCKRKKEDE